MPRRAVLGRTLGFTLATLGAFALAGCAVPTAVVLSAAAPVAHEGTAAYISNTLVFAFDAPIDQVHRAVDRAGQDLQLTPTIERPTIASDGTLRKLYLVSESIDQTPVEFRLEVITPALTRVRIRFGFWGDQAVSRLILTKIEQQVRQGRPEEVGPSGQGKLGE